MLVIDGVSMVDVHEAADLVGRTPETIRRWVWSGRLAAVKKGQKLFVSRQSLLAATSGVSPRPPTHRASLEEWAAEMGRSATGGTRSSARDLVLDDRARR